jgi:hypothetical protein
VAGDATAGLAGIEALAGSAAAGKINISAEARRSAARQNFIMGFSTQIISNYVQNLT